MGYRLEPMEYPCLLRNSLDLWMFPRNIVSYSYIGFDPYLPDHSGITLIHGLMTPKKKKWSSIYTYIPVRIYIYNYLELFTIAHSNYKILQVSGFHKLDHQNSAEKKVHHLGPRLQRHHGFLLCKAPMLCAQQGQLQRLPNLWMVYYGKSQTKRDDLGIPHDKTDTSM